MQEESSVAPAGGPARGLPAVAVVVGLLSAAALVLLPQRGVPGWPWVLAVVVVADLLLRGRWVRLGHGTDAECSISPTAAVLFAATLLLPAVLLPLVVLLRQETTGHGWRRDVINLGMDLVTVAAAVGVAVTATGALGATTLPAPVTTVLVALAAAVTWWLVSSLSIAWVLWRSLGVAVATSPALQRGAVRLMAQQLVLGITAVALVSASPWNLLVVAMLVWLLARMSDDQRAMRQAGHDLRTGLPRIEVFLDAADLELARAARTGDAVSVLMVDLDHFKRINEEHGHEAANDVLAEVGARIRGTLRVADIAGRYGGEEFCVLLRDTRAEQAVAAAERIRAEIGRAAARAGDSPVTVTASVGVAQLLTGESVPEALDRADRALKAAKLQGRDRVVLASDALQR